MLQILVIMAITITKKKIDDEDEEEEQKLPSDAIPGYNPAEIDLSVYNTPAEDIDAWWYIDKENNTQGPFVWQQMLDWWTAGFLTEDILVMKIGEDDFSPINLRKEFLVKPKPKINPILAGFHPPTRNEIRQLNIALTKFNAIANDNYWANRGLPSDPAGRQMAHYFDLDAFQEQKRREKELGIKPKAAKNWRDLRDIKKKKKIRNYVKNMLKD